LQPLLFKPEALKPEVMVRIVPRLGRPWSAAAARPESLPPLLALVDGSLHSFLYGRILLFRSWTDEILELRGRIPADERLFL
jgi:hypothetical protein